MVQQTVKIHDTGTFYFIEINTGCFKGAMCKNWPPFQILFLHTDTLMMDLTVELEMSPGLISEIRSHDKKNGVEGKKSAGGNTQRHNSLNSLETRYHSP